METPEGKQDTWQESVPAAPVTDSPSEQPAAGEEPAQPAQEDGHSGLAQDQGLPVGQVVGGGSYQAAAPDLAPEVTDPNVPGDGRDSLAYDKHSTEATTADGETVRIVVAHPITVDGRNRRSDDDALQGAACKIVDGEHKDRKGVFLSVERYDPSSGYPVQVLVRTSDDENQFLSVPYASIRPDLSQR